MVSDQVRAFLSDPEAIFNADDLRLTGVEQRKALLRDAAELAAQWPNLVASEQRRALAVLVRRVQVSDGGIDIHFVPSRLPKAIQLWRGQTPVPENDDERAHQPLVRSVSVRLQRIEKSGRLLVPGAAQSAAHLNEPLRKLLARAHQLQSMLATTTSLEELAGQVGVTPKRAASVLRLSWLAPSIVEAILNGKQPPQLTADKLVRLSRLPTDWRDQQTALGFR